MSNLFHFYHIYADGNWRKPLGVHLAALEQSGLMNELDGLFCGIVGSEEAREDVKEVFPGNVAVEADTGWEQVTLEKVHEFAQMEEAKVLYAHTKGAWSNSELATAWRESMTFDCVIRWREAVNALEKHDAAGPFWILSNEPEHREHDYFFAGNYWWANTSYLSGLPPLRNENRYQAEGWIGLRKDPKVHVLRHGYSFWGNFAPINIEPIVIP